MIHKAAATAMEPSQHDIVVSEDLCQPVYEPDESNVLGQRLVLTPWMLLDHLKNCQDEAERLLTEVCEKEIGLERRYGVLVNPLAERLERLHFGVSQLLRLLWRSGLWADSEVVEETAADGRKYRVLREPFTDGKAHGRTLPANSPNWQRELLGLSVRLDSTTATMNAMRIAGESSHRDDESVLHDESPATVALRAAA